MTKARLKSRKSEKQGGKVASRFQNKEYYFLQGLTWSDAGFYSPTIRLSGQGIFDVKGSRIISDFFSPEIGNAILSSKLLKYWIKNVNNHTVSTQVDDLRELAIPSTVNEALGVYVNSIIEKQKQKPRYDYMSNEQQTIDKLVYEMYGLNADDILEVETWYARRYPIMARFCETN